MPIKGRLGNVVRQSNASYLSNLWISVHASHNETPSTHPQGVYTRDVIPTARGVEGLAWRVAWFTVLLKVLF
jgi:hypothetical protein